MRKDFWIIKGSAFCLVCVGPPARLLIQCSQHLKDSPSISLERFDGLVYQGQVIVDKSSVPLSFCEP